MTSLPDDMLYTGVSIDIEFGPSRPTFGDLFLICGCQHPRFPPTGALPLESLADLQFDQVDDYFGVRTLEDEGEDVSIRLYPLVGGNTVHHHPGPFDGVRLEYNILRNPVRRADHFLKCVEGFSRFAAKTTYRNRHADLGALPDLAKVRKDIDGVVAYWAGEGVVVGSDKSLLIDF